QPLGVVKLDHLGVGLGVFRFSAQDRRPATGDGLPGVIRDLARSGQGYVRIAPDGQPLDLPLWLAVGEREGLDPLRGDPDAEAGAGSVADGVLRSARLVGPDSSVSELDSHDRLAGCVS